MGKNEADTFSFGLYTKCLPRGYVKLSVVGTNNLVTDP